LYRPDDDLIVRLSWPSNGFDSELFRTHAPLRKVDLFKEQPIYEQSAARTAREQQEKQVCVWRRQPLNIEQLATVLGRFSGRSVLATEFHLTKLWFRYECPQPVLPLMPPAYSHDHEPSRS
jgi:hypothetical protein